jgi:hypothetical protein
VGNASDLGGEAAQRLWPRSPGWLTLQSRLDTAVSPQIRWGAWHPSSYLIGLIPLDNGHMLSPYRRSHVVDFGQ